MHIPVLFLCVELLGVNPWEKDVNCFKMELVGTTLGCTLELIGLQEIELKQEEAKFISQYLIVIQGQKKRGLPSKNTAHSHLSQNLACVPSLFFSLNRIRSTHWEFVGLYVKGFSNAELPFSSQPFSFVLCSSLIVSDEVSLIQIRDDQMHSCEYSCSCTHVYIIHAWFLQFTLKCIIQTKLYIL